MSTDFETIIPCKAIDEKVLAELIGHLSTATGQPIALKHVYVLSTPDTGAAVMLDALRDSIKASANGHGAKPAARAKAGKHHPRQSKLAKKGEIGSKSYRNESTGQIFSTVALKRRVANGAEALHTVFVNGKGERAVVLQDEAGHYQLIKEPKA